MSLDKLNTAIGDFIQQSLSCETNILGTIEKKQNPISLKNLPIKLSPELDFLYTNYDCNITITGNNIAFTEFHNLIKRQEGFATYSIDGGKTQIKNPNWTEGWIVIADMNDDPIAANTNIEETPILAAIEGVNYMEIAPSLSAFFQILTELLKSSQLHKENEPDADENFEEWITYNQEIVQPNFLEQIRRIVNDEHLQNLKDFLFS